MAKNPPKPRTEGMIRRRGNSFQAILFAEHRMDGPHECWEVRQVTWCASWAHRESVSGAGSRGMSAPA
ncbi:hypothetical protein LWC33_19190 [Pseudonocardia sp. RS11V-5]|uniref:hypothetical protein n=1 Tax=Pseudonocardia terrae TaxID=2905831 RepID=UPI001E36EEEC|nr:hypothetical protein [Pseudonocardia terrae]MCE3553570.1 hypothetical protein [Pseudonocardia terrae]